MQTLLVLFLATNSLLFAAPKNFEPLAGLSPQADVETIRKLVGEEQFHNAVDQIVKKLDGDEESDFSHSDKQIKINLSETGYRHPDTTSKNPLLKLRTLSAPSNLSRTKEKEILKPDSPVLTEERQNFPISEFLWILTALLGIGTFYFFRKNTRPERPAVPETQASILPFRKKRHSQTDPRKKRLKNLDRRLLAPVKSPRVEPESNGEIASEKTKVVV